MVSGKASVRFFDLSMIISNSLLTLQTLSSWIFWVKASWLIKKDWEYLQASDHFYYMATKFFSDGAVHAYFNPYETPYDAFMNYMNVLSDFEIRLRQWFPDTAEQDQIYKLGNQIIERDMIIESQATEITKLSKKIGKIKPRLKSPAKRASKTTAKSSSVSSVSEVKKKVEVKNSEKNILPSVKKTKVKKTPVKSVKKGSVSKKVSEPKTKK